MERHEYEVMAQVERNHWWYGGMRRISASLLDRVHDGRQRWRILDAGCGTGGNVAFLLQRYGEVVGIDLFAIAAQKSAERLPGAIQRASIMQLPYADASFDLVTSFEVIYHKGVPSEEQALREIWRVLRPGGWLLLRLPAYNGMRRQHDLSVHTRRRYRRGEVRSLLSQSGFRPHHSSYVNSLLFPVVLGQWLVERSRGDQQDDQHSDLVEPHPLVNRLLGLPLALEAAWLRRGGSFPAGLSVIALAQKEMV